MKLVSSVYIYFIISFFRILLWQKFFSSWTFNETFDSFNWKSWVWSYATHLKYIDLLNEMPFNFNWRKKTKFKSSSFGHMYFHV